MRRSVPQVVVATLLSFGFALNAFVPASAADDDPVSIASPTATTPSPEPVESAAPGDSEATPEPVTSAGADLETPPAAPETRGP